MLSRLLGQLLRQPLRALRARRAAALFDAGMSHRASGEWQAAREKLRRAATLDGSHAGAQHGLALIHAQQGEYDAAAECLERALAVDSALPGGWIDLGDVQQQRSDLRKAEVCYRQALATAPASALAHGKLGGLLHEQGRTDEAVHHLRRAYEEDPEAQGHLRLLIAALIELDLCDKALSVAAQAVQRSPSWYEANLLLASAYHKLHQPLDALACCEAAAKLRSDDAELHDLRGAALQDLGRLPEALENYERALALRPDFRRAAFHRGLLRLLMGDFAGGWSDYELRDPSAPRASVAPRWDGAALSGRTILVYREQGLGDEIMFASLLSAVIAASGRCIVECEPRLHALFQRSFMDATVFASLPDGSLPLRIAQRRIDLEVPAGSLPRLLRHHPGESPPYRGYLKAAPLKVRRWRERLAGLGSGLKVGISWTGGVRRTRRGLRSLALASLLPVLSAPGVRFVSLQYTPEASDEITQLHMQHGLTLAHWPEAIEDYDQTAALVSALDLVVSVCTSVVHLAGALGKPVWVMAPHSPEWRYGFEGDTMPWYPTARMFRQPAFRQWEPVVSSVAEELRRLAGSEPAPRNRAARP